MSEQLRALDGMRARLLSTISYDEYIRRVEALRPVIARMPVDRMSVPCLEGPGLLAEGTYNEYIYALFPWNECIAKPGCDLATAEPMVKRRWWIAGLALSDARRDLAELE